jgi:hypothetical protein
MVAQATRLLKTPAIARYDALTHRSRGHPSSSLGAVYSAIAVERGRTNFEDRPGAGRAGAYPRLNGAPVSWYTFPDCISSAQAVAGP